MSRWFILTQDERSNANELSEAAVAGLRFRRLSAVRARLMDMPQAAQEDVHVMLVHATELCSQGSFREAYRVLTRSITKLHTCSTSDDHLSPIDYALLVACLGKRAECCLAMRKVLAAQEDCHYGLMLAGGFTEAAPKSSAVEPEVRNLLEQCFKKCVFDLRRERGRAGGGRGGRGSRGVGGGGGVGAAAREAGAAAASSRSSESSEAGASPRPASQPQEKEAETPWVGAVVKIHSLVASPEHNGVTGTVQIYDASKGRWGVKVASGRVLSLKPQNLMLLGRASHKHVNVNGAAAGGGATGDVSKKVCVMFSIAFSLNRLQFRK